MSALRDLAQSVGATFNAPAKSVTVRCDDPQHHMGTGYGDSLEEGYVAACASLVKDHPECPDCNRRHVAAQMAAK